MKDFLPAIYPSNGADYRAADAEEPLYNCTPWLLHNQKIGVCPRNEYANTSTFTPSAASDRGRGVLVYEDEFDQYCANTTYYYQGGSQDMDATTGQGYAGNTGLNEEYIASFVYHKISGSEGLVIVNAGHTSTNASAKHGNVWYQSGVSSTPDSVSDADLPCNNGVSITRGGASMDGYFFVCDITGKIYNSALNDITSWTATDFLTAEREPDVGIYLGKHHDSLVYIGTRSIEFFYNAGNASGSPLGRRTDASYNIGSYFPNTIVEVGDILYFVGVDHMGRIRVYKLENFQLTPISDAKLEAKLRVAVDDIYPDITELDPLESTAWLSPGFANLSPGLIFTHQENFSYFWHELTGIWCRWGLAASPTHKGGLSSWAGIFPVISFNRGGMGDPGQSTRPRYQFANGEIGYEAAPDNNLMSDMGFGGAADVFTQMPRWDAGTDQKKNIRTIRVISEPIADESGANDPLQVYLRWHDFRSTAATVTPPYTGGNDRTVDLNIRGQRLYRLGTTRERQYALDWDTGSGPVTVFLGLEIDYDLVG